MSKISPMLWSLCLLLALLVSAPAATIYVAITGSDTAGDGTEGNPYRTIQKGIDAAAMSGDTVQVGAGTYREIIVWDSKSLTLQGAGAGSTIIDGDVDRDGQGDDTCLEMFNVPETACLTGFTIQHGRNAEDLGGGGMTLYDSHATLANNNFTNNDTPYDGGGGVRIDDSDATLINNTFTGNHASSGGAIYMEGSTATLIGNTFTNNSCKNYGGGIGIFGGCGGTTLTQNSITNNETNSSDKAGGVSIRSGNITVTNNTIAENDGTGLLIREKSVTVTNNTIANNQGDGLHVSGGYKALIANCILWGNGGNGDLVEATAIYSDIGVGGTGDNGNISEDPRFVGGSNYHLSIDSPCINTGTNAAQGLPDNDIDGEPRILYGVVDMGADEVSHLMDLQPDLWVQQGDTWLGDNIYNTHGANQTTTIELISGETALFPAKLVNDGTSPDSYVITGPGGDPHWNVEYYSGVSVDPGAEVTANVTGSGWVISNLAAGASVDFLIAVTPDVNTEGSNHTLVTATSNADATQLDAIKAITNATLPPNLQPDLWIQQEIWQGDNIYNGDGTDQTGACMVYLEETAVYQAQLENDGEETETYWIKGPPGAGNWNVDYYWGSSVREDRKVTQWVIRPQGWKLRNVPAGGVRQFLITVTPGAAATGDFSVQVFAESGQYSDQRDCILAVTSLHPTADLWIKRGPTFIGDDIYSDDGTDQYTRQRVTAGATAKFYGRLYNDGDEVGDFWLKHLSPLDPDYTVEYYWGAKLIENRKVTQWVMRPQGWRLFNVPPGGMRQFLITVTPNSRVASGDTCATTVRAEADGDPTNLDTIQGIVRVK